MEEYNALQYPEGVERISEEMLAFLSDDKAAQEAFMVDVLQCLVQW